MKDITLKITGTQMYDDKEEDQLEFVTDGKLYERNGSIYVVYEESEVSGMEGCKTAVRVEGDTVKMKRIGALGFNTELCFEKGKRFSSVYETPYGPMDIEVLTNMVNNNIDLEKLRGKIDIEYDVSLSGYAEGKNRITIDVM